MSYFVYFFCLISFILFCLFILYLFKRFGQGWSFKVLFTGFNRKIWMTFCLGGVYFSLYLFIVSLSVYFMRNQGTALLLIAYQHPIELVYGGLWLFACLSLTIYLTRLVIKYFYLTRGKDN